MQERIYFDLSNVYQNLYQLDEQVEIDSDDFVVDYLISEGYTGSVEGAEVILSNMSEEWYNIIVEGLPKTATMNRQQHASAISALTAELNKLKQLSRSPKGLTPQQLAKQAQLSLKLSKLRKSESELLQGQGAERQLTKPKPTAEVETVDDGDDDDELSSSNYKRQMRDLRGGGERTLAQSLEARKKMAERRKRQAAGRAQITKDEAPTKTTDAQSDAERETERLYIDPASDPRTGSRMTYRTRSGEQRLLNVAGRTRQIRTDATRRERRSGASQIITRPNTTGSAVRGSTRNR